MEVDVVSIQRRGMFTLGQANNILPIVKHITGDYSEEVEKLMVQLEMLPINAEDKINEVESLVNKRIREWHHKIKKLGGAPKGLWMVDFECGNGSYCWQYPESKIKFWRSSEESFKDRVPLGIQG